MNDIMTADKVKKLMQPLLEKGCFFDYFYEKGGDSSCVYICRFKRGKDFWDWREVSGSTQINLVTYVNGQFGFPSLKKLYPKEHFQFSLKHFFRKATKEENREFIASLLKAELAKNESTFLGIKL